MRWSTPNGPTHADILVVGNGMVGHRFVEAAVERGLLDRGGSWSSARSAAGPTTGCTCRRCSTARPPTTCTLGDADLYDDRRRRAGARRPVVVSSTRRPHGSPPRRAGGPSLTATACWPPARAPFVPPIPGTDAAGCFVYRTLDDLAAIRDWAQGCRTRRRRRRRAARARGRQRLAPARAGHDGRRVRAAPDGRAARRRRRGGAAPPRRGARPARCAPARRPPRCAPATPTAASPG